MTTQRSRAELTPGLAFPVNVAANQTRPPSPLQSPPFSSFRPATLTHATCLPSLTPVPLPFPSLSFPFLFLLSPFFLICFLYGKQDSCEVLSLCMWRTMWFMVKKSAS